MQAQGDIAITQDSGSNGATESLKRCSDAHPKAIRQGERVIEDFQGSNDETDNDSVASTQSFVCRKRPRQDPLKDLAEYLKCGQNQHQHPTLRCHDGDLTAAAIIEPNYHDVVLTNLMKSIEAREFWDIITEMERERLFFM